MEGVAVQMSSTLQRPWLSVPAEAERVTGRVEVDPERVTDRLPRLYVVLRGTQLQDLRLDRVDVVHGDVEVELLRPLAVRPGRRGEIFRQLERQPQPVHHEDHPVILDGCDLPAHEFAVELGEALRGGAVKDNSAQTGQ